MEALAPKARGYLLSAVADSLLRLQDVPDTNLPRMADFAYHGEAISRTMGYPDGKFFEIYAKSISEQVEEAIHGSILGELLLTWMERREKWQGTPSELLAELRTVAEGQKLNISDNHFPKAPNVLTRKLNILKTDLSEIGITYKQDTGGERRLTIYRKPNASTGQSLQQCARSDEKNIANETAAQNSEVNGRSGDTGDTFQKWKIEAENGEMNGSENTAGTAETPANGVRMEGDLAEDGERIRCETFTGQSESSGTYGARPVVRCSELEMKAKDSERWN